MNVIAFAFFVIAAAIFAVSWLRPAPARRWKSETLGLAVLTVGFIVQFVWLTDHVIRVTAK